MIFRPISRFHELPSSIGTVDVGFTTGGTVGPVLIGYLFDITSNYQLWLLLLAVAC